LQPARALELGQVPAHAERIAVQRLREFLERDEQPRLAPAGAFQQKLQAQGRLARAGRAAHQDRRFLDEAPAQ